MFELKINKLTKKEMLEQLRMEKEDIDIVMRYQRLFPSLLVTCKRDGFSVDSEQLWRELGKPYTNYRQWFSRKISKNYENGINFLEVYINGESKLYSRNADEVTKVYTLESEQLKGLREMGYTSTDKNEMQLIRAGYSKNRVFTLEAAKAIAMRQMDELGDLVVKYFIIMEDTVKNKIIWLKERNPQIEGYKDMTKALDRQYMKEGEIASNFVYSNNANMINRALFDRTSKEISELAENENIRDSFHLDINKAIRDLQDINKLYIELHDFNYQTRKEYTEEYVKLKYSHIKIEFEKEIERINSLAG